MPTMNHTHTKSGLTTKACSCFGLTSVAQFRARLKSPLRTPTPNIGRYCRHIGGLNPERYAFGEAKISFVLKSDLSQHSTHILDLNDHCNVDQVYFYLPLPSVKNHARRVLFWVLFKH
jgi:hypothetical protein